MALAIDLLGEPAVRRDGVAAALPASRKARALLAYLALTGRPHRRERLCELFWDLPDDPRAALRWALSKLRAAIGSDPSPLVADRERVALDTSDIAVDFAAMRARLFDDPPFIPPPDLREMASGLSRTLLDGLDGAGGDAFAAWLAAEREDAALLRANVLRRLALHPDVEDAEKVKWSAAWQDAAPLEPGAMKAVVETLRRVGRTDEADRSAARFEATLDAAGLPVPDLSPVVENARDRPHRRGLRRQTVGFARAADGVHIAYATVGSGPPLVKAANWLNHLELDWNSPIWGRTFGASAVGRTFVRYDERGNGLSDWTVDDLSFEAFVADLECVVDTLGIERFPLLGISQGCAVSIEYAVRHPRRVSGLILISGYAAGWRIGASAEERARREAVLTLTRHGWGTSNPAYRHIFSQTFMPDAKPEDLEWFDEFQRQTTSPENAVRFQEAFATIDVRDRLGDVRAPTIVFHSRGDQRIALDQGRALAVGIPGARFVPLASRNHILLGHEPAWTVCRDACRRFLSEHGI